MQHNNNILQPVLLENASVYEFESIVLGPCYMFFSTHGKGYNGQNFSFK